MPWALQIMDKDYYISKNTDNIMKECECKKHLSERNKGIHNKL